MNLKDSSVSGTALAAGVFQSLCCKSPVASGLLIESFNGKPQASLPCFAYAYACGSPLNENAEYTAKSTPR